MFESIKNLIKENWKYFAKMGYDYLAKHLISRVRTANPFYARLLEQGIQVGDETIDILTDNDKDNARQMAALMEKHYVELLSLTLAGSSLYIRPGDRQRVSLILAETIEKLQGLPQQAPVAAPNTPAAS
jgi:hypothetical protein